MGIAYTARIYDRLRKRYMRLIPFGEELAQKEDGFWYYFFEMLLYAHVAGTIGVLADHSVPPLAEVKVDDYVVPVLERAIRYAMRELPPSKREKVKEVLAGYLPSEAMIRSYMSYAGLFFREMVSRRELPSLWAVVTAESTRAYNIGVITAARKSQIIAGFVFNAVLDERTSRFCRPRAGMFIPIHDVEKLIRNSPPLHPHCRSTLVPVSRPVGKEIDDALLPTPPFFSPQAEFVKLALLGG